MKSWLLLTFAFVSAGVVGVWIVGSYSVQTEEQKTTPELDAAELDLVIQKEIWDAEHVTFEIERRFGKELLNGLVKSDRGRMLSFFREGFQGTGSSHFKKESLKSGLITEERKSMQISTTKVSADDLVTSLIAPVADFKKIERSRLRVLSIKREGESDRWETRLLITLVGTGTKGGRVFFESEHEVKFLISDAETIDQDAVIDRWIVETETRRTAPRFLMEEVTEQTGLAKLSLPDNWKLLLSKRMQQRFQTAVADFDRDGDLDIAIASVHQKPILLKSKAGKDYEEVASQLGVTLPPKTDKLLNIAASWIDYDNDGFPDLVMGNQLFHNIEGKQFDDVTQQSGLVVEAECMGCVVADFDCDGLVDIYLLHQGKSGDMQSSSYVGDSDSGRENQLWRNEGGGRFRNVTEESLSGGGKRHTHAAAWFFLDDDHFPDLYIANDFGSNVILRNRGDGTFEDVSAKTGASDFATSMGVAVGDVNNDGRTDVYVANMYSKMGRRIIGQVSKEDYPKGIFQQIEGSCAGNRLYLNGSDSGFQEESDRMNVNAVGWAYAPAMVDLDGDGWLDLYATTGFMSFDPKEPDG